MTRILSAGRVSLLLTIFAGFGLQSCFTGIESTPRIGESELRRQHVTVSAEQEFLSDIRSDSPLLWMPGKKFYVTDSKINLIFTSASTGTDSLGGEVITFCRFDRIPAVDNNNAAEAVFTHGSDTLFWRPGIDVDSLASRVRLDIPFTIDLDIIDKVRSKMVGNTYYIITPLWYDPTSMQPTGGLRHIAVEITDIRPGTAAMPFNVVFRPQNRYDTGEERSVLMTVGDDRLATRNFYRLFTFDNPRRRYPAITDEVWNLIVRSKVREGMTRDECRLALGAPLQIIHGSGTLSTSERWSYPDGVYLIFEDGYLLRFRQ